MATPNTPGVQTLTTLSGAEMVTAIDAGGSVGAQASTKTIAQIAQSLATYYFTGTAAATAQAFFVAPVAMTVTAISEIHSVAAGGVSTLTVTHETGTTAPGSGTSVMSNSFNLNGTANTPQTATLTASQVTLAAGDRLSVKFANAIQSSAGIVVTATLVPT